MKRNIFRLLLIMLMAPFIAGCDSDEIDEQDDMSLFAKGIDGNWYDRYGGNMCYDYFMDMYAGRGWIFESEIYGEITADGRMVTRDVTYTPDDYIEAIYYADDVLTDFRRKGDELYAVTYPCSQSVMIQNYQSKILKYLPNGILPTLCDFMLADCSVYYGKMRAIQHVGNRYLLRLLRPMTDEELAAYREACGV